MSDDARPRAQSTRSRALAVVGAVSGVLAIGLAVSAFTVLNPASGVVLETETATLAPSVEPLEPVSSATESDVVESDTGTTSDGQADGSPPTTAEEPEPEPVAKAPRVPPTGIVIDSLDLSGYVIPVGLEDNGAMEVPSVDEIGWYLYGATPGRPGATVLVAHVWWGDRAGPFHRLGAVEPGETVEVEIDGGNVHQYQIVERTMYDKDALPSDLWRNTGPETLVLITCGGDFDRSSRRYEQNIVVYAVPIDASEAGVY